MRPGDAVDRASCLRVPVGRRQTGQHRYKHHPLEVSDGVGYGRRLGSGPDDLQTVTQPLDCRAGDEDGVLQSVGQSGVGSLPGNRRQETGITALQLFSVFIRMNEPVP